MRKITITLISLLFMFGCTSKRELATVESVDLKKYIGTWYEIARLPNKFEKNLKCVTATYSLKENGGIKVVNKGYNSKKEKWEEANGNAKVPNSSKPGEIKVSFFRPFYGDYFIIELDKNYKQVLVGSPSREYLWILSRTKTIDDTIYNQYLKTSKDRGFEISGLEKTPQDCEN